MESKQTRRNFIKSCAMISGACCTFSLTNKLLATNIFDEKDKIDLNSLSYCGIACENQCDLYKATKEDDLELKRKIYNSWGWKEKFGIDYDPEKVFCFNCKPGNKPLKIGMKECAVRICSIENGIESCVQCRNLKTCEKDFWKKWPDFYKNIIKLQEQYSVQQESVLLDIKQ